MKIISIAWYNILPPLFGGQKGIACFNEYLGRQVPLTCICSSDNDRYYPAAYTIRAELPVGKLQFINPFCWKKIRRIVQYEQPTHILLEHPYHALAARRAAGKTGARLVLHSHNIEYERFRLAGKTGWRMLRWYERWAHRQADWVLFKTEADREQAVNEFGLARKKCLVVPYGVDWLPMTTGSAVGTRWLSGQQSQPAAGIRSRYAIRNEEKILLFAGTLDYAPNAAAMEWIYTNLAPGLDAAGFRYRIIICGRLRNRKYNYLKQLQHPHVSYAGEVNNIAAYFAAADVFINPVQSGSGVQTKNIEALAHHCNLVCFNNMLDAKTRELGAGKTFTANNTEEFIRQLQSAGKHKEETPAAFFAYYNWSNIINRLLEELRG